MKKEIIANIKSKLKAQQQQDLKIEREDRAYLMNKDSNIRRSLDFDTRIKIPSPQRSARTYGQVSSMTA